MTTDSSRITRRFARYIALPAVSAGILGGAALGLAGMANAGTYPTHDQTPRTGIVATPPVKAQPPLLMYPGKRWGHVIATAPDAE